MNPMIEAASSSPSRVLVVDDDRQIRDFLVYSLGLAGYTVRTANSTDEAISCLAGEAFDVALVDLMMPDRSGLELLEEIAAREIDVVPVLLTGTNDVAVAVEAMKRGAVDYLPKPPIVKDLWRCVERAVKEVRSRRREKRLENLVANWTATFNACPDLMLVLDFNGLIVHANRAAAEKSGRSGDELPGLTPLEVFPGELGHAFAICGMEAPPQKLIESATGRHYIISSNIIPGAAGSIAIAREITALVRAEAAQARLYRQLLTAQEDERGRIARELHDGIAQSIVSLVFGLQNAANRLAPAEAAQHTQLLQTAGETLEDIRRIAQGLRPRVLDDLGLAAAMEILSANFQKSHGIRSELVIASPLAARLPSAIEHTVYRVVQEALANVAKHARASGVDIALDAGECSVSVSIADDGCGFATASGNGMGLADMRERVELHGGTFHMKSQPGRGTTISFAIPIRETPT